MNIGGRKKRTKIIIISVISVVIIALTIFLSVYFCISIDVNKQIEDFFAIEGELEYFNNTTGESIILDSTIGDYIIDIYKDTKFTNTIYLKCIIGGGISLSKNNKELVIFGNYIVIEDKWYKASKVKHFTILDEIEKHINNLN